MNPEQQKSILVIALYAAFADGAKHDREREEIRRIAESLGGEPGAADLARLYQDVLLKRVTLEAAAAELQDPGERQLAYEMAVCVCDADGRQSEAEQRFLNELKALLKLDAGQAAAFEREADVIVELSEAAAPAVVAGAVVAAQPNVTEAELDKSILNYALMNGALELLPQSWASMAIIPLQIKMVYGIGRAHGVQLDQGQGWGSPRNISNSSAASSWAACSARPPARPSARWAVLPPAWPSPSPPPTRWGNSPSAITPAAA